MEDKPKVKPEIAAADKFIEIIGWFAVLFLFIYTFMISSSLPSMIPTHYNIAGQADDFGGEGSILVLPVMIVFICLGLTTLNRFPHLFNYPLKITKENAIRQYSNATRMLRILKFDFVVVFTMLTNMSVQPAKGHSDGLGFWFLPFSMGLIFIPLIYFIFRAFRLK